MNGGQPKCESGLLRTHYSLFGDRLFREVLDTLCIIPPIRIYLPRKEAHHFQLRYHQEYHKAVKWVCCIFV